MKKVLFLMSSIVVICITQISCVHYNSNIVAYVRDAARNPAGTSSEPCSKMQLSELIQFKKMALSTKGIEESMDYISKLSRDFGLDEELYQTKNLTLSHFEVKGKGIDYTQVATFVEQLTGSCNLVREGLKSGEFADPKKNPTLYKKIAGKCGTADLARTGGELRHPYKPRDFSPSSGEVKNRVQAWIFDINKVYDSSNGKYADPDSVLNKCEAFKKMFTVEDAIEKLFLCSAAFDFSMRIYDPSFGTYLQDDNGNFEFQKPSLAVRECFSAYISDQVKIDKLGFPIPKGNSQDPLKTSVSKNSTEKKPDSKIYSEPQVPEQSNSSQNTAQSALPLASMNLRYLGDDLTKYQNSEQLKDVLDAEYSDYLYQIAKHTAVTLAQGYLSATIQKSQPGPSAFNRSLNEFVAACPYSRLRDDLSLMMAPEYVVSGQQKNIFDNSKLEFKFVDPRIEKALQDVQKNIDNDQDQELYFTPRYNQIQNIAALKGKRMVQTALQLKELRKLVTLLNDDFGGKELELLKLPEWFSYAPLAVLRHMAGAPVGISWHHYTDAQCNFFVTNSPRVNTMVPYGSNLITNADSAVQKMLGDEIFRKRAFCTNDPTCAFPDGFSKYYFETHPKQIESVRGKKDLRLWCQMKQSAIQSLLDMENQLITMYPALGYLDTNKRPFYESVVIDHSFDKMVDQLMKETSSGSSVHEARLKYENSAENQIATDAYYFAEKTLPKIQTDLKNYLRQICIDLSHDNKRSFFLAYLNKPLMGSFDYCSMRSKPFEARAQTPCAIRAKLHESHVAREAKAWSDQINAPQEYFNMIMTTVEVGMDAMFLYGAGSGGLSAGFSKQGAAYGGATSALFTGVEMAFTDWYAKNYLSQLDPQKMALTALGYEGVEGYLNRFEEMSRDELFSGKGVGKIIEEFAVGAMMSSVDLHKGGKSGHFKTELSKRISGSVELKSGKPVINAKNFDSNVRGWLHEQVKKNPEFIAQLDQAQHLFFKNHPELSKYEPRLTFENAKSASQLEKNIQQAKSDLEKKNKADFTSDEKVVYHSKPDSRAIQEAMAGLPKEVRSELQALIDEALSSKQKKSEKLARVISRLCAEVMLCPGSRRLGCPL